MKRCIFCTLALLVGLATNAIAANGVLLRLRPQAGQSFPMYVLTTTQTSQTLQGQTLDVSQTLGIEYEFRVDEVDTAGSSVMTVTYKSVLFKLAGPTGEMAYSSKDPVPPTDIAPLAKVMAALAGANVSVRMTPTGQVTEVHGISALIQRMLDAIQAQDPAVMPQIKESILGQFGDEAFAKGMQSLLSSIPEGPVEVGSSWSTRAEVSFGFPLVIEAVSTLTSREGGRLTIKEEGTIRSSGEGDGLALGLGKMKLALSGKLSGTSVMDEATGWTTRGESLVSFSGTVTLSGLPGQPGDLSYPMSSVTKTSISTDPLF